DDAGIDARFSRAMGFIAGDEAIVTDCLPLFQCFCNTPIIASIPSRTTDEDCWTLLSIRQASNTASFRSSAKMSSQLKQTSISRMTAAMNTWCITDQTTELGGMNVGASSSMILLISRTLRAD